MYSEINYNELGWINEKYYQKIYIKLKKLKNWRDVQTYKKSK